MPNVGQPIAAGSTPGLVELSRDASTGVFVLALCGGTSNAENRWTLDFSRAVHVAFDAVERACSADPKGSPAALLTVSGSEKFFSNGIDPAWAADPATSAEDKRQWSDLVMPAFARPLLLPCPTVCAIGGHAFGAGMMFALGHDYRIQRTERGYQCAIEVAIGVPTPPPEFTLFAHAMPRDAFYQTVLEARRWTGRDAYERGVVQRAVPGSQLLDEAFKEAARLAKLSSAGVFGYTKWHTKKQVVKEILSHTFPKGKRKGSAELPSGLARHVQRVVVDGKAPWTAALGKGATKL